MSFTLCVTANEQVGSDGDDMSVAESDFSNIVCNQMLFGSDTSVNVPKRKKLVAPESSSSLKAPDRREVRSRRKELHKESHPVPANTKKTVEDVAPGTLPETKENERRANNISHNLEDLLNRVHAYEEVDVQKLSEVKAQKPRKTSEKSSTNASMPRKSSHLTSPSGGDSRSWIESSLSEQNQSHLMKIMARKRKQREAAMKAAGIESDVEAQLHLSTSLGKKMPSLMDDSKNSMERPPKQTSKHGKTTETVYKSAPSPRKVEDAPINSTVLAKTAPQSKVPSSPTSIVKKTPIPDAINLIAEKASSIPKISEASLREIATRKIQEAFHSVNKDENGYIDEAAFLDAVKQLELPWSDMTAKSKFTGLDLIDMGCLCFEEFNDGVMEDVMEITKKNPYPVSPNAQVRAEFIIKSATESNPAMPQSKKVEEPTNQKKKLNMTEREPSFGGVAEVEAPALPALTNDSSDPDKLEKPKTYGEGELSPRFHGTMYQAAEFNKSPQNVREIIKQESRKKCQTIFETLPKISDDSIDFAGFRKAFDDIEVDWDFVKIRKFWNDHTVSDAPMDYKAFEANTVNVIQSTFNYLAGPEGSDCLNQPENEANVSKRLPPNRPLVVVGFVNSFGQLSTGEWVRQSELVKYRSLDRKHSTLSCGAHDNSVVRFDMTPSYRTIASRDAKENTRFEDEEITPAVPPAPQKDFAYDKQVSIEPTPQRASGHHKQVSVESFHSCDEEPNETVAVSSSTSSNNIQSTATVSSSTSSNNTPYSISSVQITHEEGVSDVSEQPPVEQMASGDIPEIFHDLHEYGEAENQLTGLPATKGLVQHGSVWVKDIESGAQQNLAAAAFFIDGLNKLENSERIVTEVGSLASRFSALDLGQKVFHPHENLFVLMSKSHERSAVEMWATRAVKYIKTRCLRDFGSLRFVNKSVFYEKGEGFGRFIERLIEDLDPKIDFITEETRQKLDEILYKIVADRSSFSNFANQILRSQKARKWTEEEVCQCIRKLVKRGAQGNYVDDENHGVVMYAMRRGHNVIVKHILTEHPILVKPRELNTDNMNLLMVALYYKRVNDENLIQLIQNYDLDHSIEDKRHRNTMVHALNANRYLVAVEIVKAGAVDIIKDLRDASEADDVAVLKRYFNQGLQMQCDVDENGTTLGCFAAKSGACDILKFLIRLRTTFGKDSKGHSAIHQAAMLTKSHAIEVLLTDTRIDVNEQSKNGSTALLIAASGGSLENVQALLHAGADTDIVDDSKCSPLIAAASKGYVEICDALLKRGCNTEFKDINGLTAFDVATNNGFQGVVKSLTVVE